jgi:DNA-binding transcriptional ArsR family regulator
MKAELLSVLAEPNRLHIIELLRKGPHPVGEIVTKLKIRQPQVSKHLHVLSEYGFVDMQPAAQQRIYSLKPQPFQEIDDWLQSYRDLWNERLDRLDDYLIKLQEDEMKKRGKKHGRK